MGLIKIEAYPSASPGNMSGGEDPTLLNFPFILFLFSAKRSHNRFSAGKR
jgi:hypothetical protein